MGRLFQDVRYGLRQLRRNPGFTAVAVVTLALGIGATTAMFSVVSGVLLQPLPYKDSERLAQIVSLMPYGHGEMVSISSSDFPYIRSQTDTLDGMALYGYAAPTLTGQGEPEVLVGGAASPDLFPLLGVRPILGREFIPEDTESRESNVAVLSHRLWQRRFGGDPGVVGKTVTLNDQLYTIVGVMPAGFAFPSRETEIWLPLALSKEEAASHTWRARRLIARLKNGVDLQRAQVELDTVAARLAKQFPDDKGWGLRVRPLKEMEVASTRPALLLLLGAVALLLLIACANVANLLLARAWTRQKEIAVREALGAGRWRIVRQLTTESLLLALAGGGLGLLLTPWGILFIRAISPSDVPRLDAVAIDRWVLCFSFGLSLLTGLLFGLAPALQASKPDVNAALKEGAATFGFGTGVSSTYRTRASLVVAEVALALLLMVGATLLVRSFWRLTTEDPGFDPHNILTAELGITSRKYASPQAEAAFYQQTLERVRGLPGVKAAALSNLMPFSGFMTVSFSIEGRPQDRSQEQPQVGFYMVSSDYFRTVGLRLLKGRVLTEHDTQGGPTAIVIDESMARQYLQGEDPLGKHVHVDWGSKGFTGEVVGVVSEVRDVYLGSEPHPKLYASYAQAEAGGFLNLLVRTASAPLALAAPVREQVWAINRDQPVTNLRTVEQDIWRSVAEPRFRTLMLAIFAGLALILAVVGIYGVTSYTVTRRTHEIGVRMALGAGRNDVVRLIVRQGMTLTLLGVGIGLAGAMAVMRFLTSMLYGVHATDLTTFVAVPVILAAVATLASYIPARRAAKVDPMVALRYE